MGTFIKFEDYLTAFGMGGLFYDWIIMMAAFALATTEFAVGVYLVIGISRLTAAALALTLMAVMTPLTLYIAIANPVSDCGCFGDALVLGNMETFIKNLVLLAMAIITFKKRNELKSMVSAKTDWIISMYTVLFALVLSAYCLRNLPILDFRPYRIGVNITEGMQIPEGKKGDVWESRFLMEKDGEQREFTIEDYPDSTWTYLSTRSFLKEKGYQPPIHDFSIQRMSDGEELTDSILADPNYTFILVAPHIEDADDSNIDLINEIYDYALEYGYGFIALTASPQEEVNIWNERTGGEYPFYSMDDITMKTMIRSNPGLMLLKKGTIYNKWSQAELPDEYVLTDRLENIPLGEIEERNDMKTLGYVLLWFVIPLLGTIGIDNLWLSRSKKKTKTTI